MAKFSYEHEPKELGAGRSAENDRFHFTTADANAIKTYMNNNLVRVRLKEGEDFTDFNSLKTMLETMDDRSFVNIQLLNGHNVFGVFIKENNVTSGAGLKINGVLILADANTKLGIFQVRKIGNNNFNINSVKEIGGDIAGIKTNGEITISKNVNIKDSKLWISNTEDYSPTDENRVLNLKHIKQLAAAEKWDVAGGDVTKADLEAQEAADAQARAANLELLHEHKKDLGIETLPYYHNFDVLGLSNRKLFADWQGLGGANNNNNIYPILREIINKLKTDRYWTFNEFNTKGFIVEVTKGDNDFSKMLTQLETVLQWTSRTPPDNTTFRIIIARRANDTKNFAIIIGTTRNVGVYSRVVTYNTDSDNFGNLDNYNNHQYLGWVNISLIKETLSATNTNVKDADREIKSLLNFVNEKALNPSWKNITSTYRTRNWTNDYGKFIKITTSNRHMIGEIKKEYKLSYYDKNYNGIFAKSFLTDESPSQSYIWSNGTGNAALKYKGGATVNLVTNRVYHFNLGTNELITKFEIFENFSLAEIIKETGIVTLASLTPELRDQLGIDAGIKQGKVIFVGQYNTTNYGFDPLYRDPDVITSITGQLVRSTNVFTFNLKNFNPGHYRVYLKVAATGTEAYNLKWFDASVYHTQKTLLGNSNAAGGSYSQQSSGYILRNFYPGYDYRIRIEFFNNGKIVNLETEGRQHKRIVNGAWQPQDQFYKIEATSDVVNRTGRLGSQDVIARQNGSFVWDLDSIGRSASSLTSETFIEIHRLASA